MLSKPLNEAGVFSETVQRGHRRWVYREHLSVRERPGSAEICASVMSPGLAFQNQAALREVLAR